MRFRFLTAAALLGATFSAQAQLKSTNAPAVRISLQEAVEQSLQNNFRIAIQRVTARGTLFDLKSSYGIYDPVYSLNFLHTSQTREGQFSSSSGLASPDSVSQVDSVGQSIGGYLPSGLTYNLGVSFDHRTGSTGTGPFDQYGSSLGFTTLTQPLLKNFWIDDRRRTLRIARLNRDISDLDFEYQVNQTIRDVHRAYYSLAAADEDIKVALSAHELAAQLARDIRRRVEVGNLAPLEDKQAESRAQTELANYYAAVHRRNTAENVLKGLISRKFRTEYDGRIEPSDKLLAIERRAIDLQESWKSGLEKRPDYRAYFLRAEQNRVNLRYSRNQFLPRLDVVGSYSRNGLDSATASPFNEPSLGGSFHDISRNSQPSHTYGVVLSSPLTYQAERNNLKKAKSNQEQVLLELQQLEQQILVVIDDNISLIKSSSMRIQATRAAEAAAAEALAAEEKKLQKGVVSPSDVLRKQDDYNRARSETIRALLDYNGSLSDLDMNDGTIQERNNVQIQSLK